MSNILVEGFATYGTGSNGTAMRSAFLAGAWAEISNSATLILGSVPWDSSNKDVWLSGGNSNFGGGPYYLARRVLPAAKSKARFSFHMAVPSLPTANDRAGAIRFPDSTNTKIATLMIGSTGTLILDYAAGTLVTSGPVIVAEKDHHVELEIDMTNKTFKAYVDGTQVLDGSAINFSNASDVAQFGAPMWNASTSAVYLSNLIVRDDSGTYNNTFPIGDRRVATLYVNADDADHDGWTPQYLRRFGVGILDLTAASAAVAAEITTDTDIGANEFTIEGQFRFQNLPTAANKAVLFGKWDADNNKRSYELYLGGPDLDNGLLVWRTSTDGTDSTTEDKVKWQWRPDVGHWYHIAMCRSDGELLLFIDGVQQGVSVADTDTYYAGTARAAIGAEMSSGSVEAGTIFDGWQDEFRFTIGGSRYTANFTPPTEGFPRDTDDPNWGEVKWLSSWDTATVVDDGPVTLALSALNSAVAITPNDGLHAYETMNKNTPDDDTFLEAALIPADGTFTMTDIPVADETVTVGTKDGSTAAVYKWVSTLADAFDVLIGANLSACAANLVAAINKADGEGTTFGTGTVANADVSAEQLPSNQVKATALVAGTDGNSIASTETCTNAAWGGSTLSGGLDIPTNSQFGLSRLPSNTTVVDSLTIVGRQWKTDSGSGTTKMSFVGAGGEVAAGEAKTLGVLPSLTFDTIESDPDTSAGLTATSVLLGKIRINRAA